MHRSIRYCKMFFIFFGEDTVNADDGQADSLKIYCGIEMTM